MNAASPLVGVVMGSSSDGPTMQAACDVLAQLGVSYEARVVSAQRMPDEMFRYAETAAGRGLHVIIAGAGGAAHLPGMIAAKTHLPVLGVPVQSRALNGLDSLLSIVQMPGGVPVGTLAVPSETVTTKRSTPLLSRPGLYVTRPFASTAAAPRAGGVVTT